MNMVGQIAPIFHALGNQTRLEIVKLILSKKEISCQELRRKFPLSQPTMSHHFGLLLASGILTARKVGVRQYYRINGEKLRALGINLAKI